MPEAAMAEFPVVPAGGVPGPRRPAPVADCPHCERRLLAPARAGNARILHCYTCGGTWVPHSAAAELHQSFPGVGNLEPRKLNQLRGAAAMKNLREGVRYLACPICNERMSRRQFALGSGIVVDRCLPHGVWFDRGELELAAEYFEAGGPHDAARRKSDLREKKYIPITRGELGEPATSALAKLLLWLI